MGSAGAQGSDSKPQGLWLSGDGCEAKAEQGLPSGCPEAGESSCPTALPGPVSETLKHTEIQWVNV